MFMHTCVYYLCSGLPCEQKFIIACSLCTCYIYLHVHLFTHKHHTSIIVQVLNMREIMRYLSFWIWVILQYNNFPDQCFSWKYHDFILLCGWVYHIFILHSSVDGDLDWSISLLLCIVQLCTGYTGLSVEGWRVFQIDTQE